MQVALIVLVMGSGIMSLAAAAYLINGEALFAAIALMFYIANFVTIVAMGWYTLWKLR